jgi:DNA-binding SARP family transcriptional activator
VSRVAVQVFGPMRVMRDGALVPTAELTPARVRELLLYLVLHPPRTKEQIGLALWPDASPAQVRNHFHVTLHQLRRALGHKEAVVFDGGTYALAREGTGDGDAADAPTGDARGVVVHCDVDAVLAAANAARAAVRALVRDGGRSPGAAAGPGAARAADARTADTRAADTLAAWRAALRSAEHGVLGEGEDVGEWITAHAARVSAAWAEGMEALARLHLQQGAPLEAAAVLEALVAAEPLREGAHRALMATYVAAGEPARALSHYQALAALLEREVGAAPGRETRALADSIRAHDGAGGRPAP